MHVRSSEIIAQVEGERDIYIDRERESEREGERGRERGGIEIEREGER